MRSRFFVPLVLPAMACASSGTRPSDMTARSHEAAAASEQQQAEHHAEQYDPLAPPRRYFRAVMNPTEHHKKDAATHRRLAEKHRAASAALRNAEARACQGLAAEDRDMSPFNHREDIERVEPIEKKLLGPGGLEGARVVFRAAPGMTAEWLQRLIDCHVARGAAFGFQEPELAYCPLAVGGVSAKVKSVGNGFAVEIVATDERTAAEVIGRARALAPER